MSKSYINIITFKNNEKIEIYLLTLLTKTKIIQFEKTNIIKNSIEYIISVTKKNHHIYINNLNYDGILILEELSKYIDYKIEVKYFNLEIFFIKITYENKNIHFWCAKKLIPDKLENLIKNFSNLNFKPIPINFNIKNNQIVLNNQNFSNNLAKSKFEDQINTNDDIKCIIKINSQNNIKIFKQLICFIDDFFKNYNINHIKNKIYSASGFAYNCFFNNFNGFNISKNITESLDNYIRDSYFGGRCEVFGNPNTNENIFYIDYIGMYSQCMEEKFPINEGHYEFNINNIEKIGFYDITYLSTNLKYPVLPNKNLNNNKIMFCNGENRGVFWYEEILLFLKMNGTILKIHGGYLYEKSDLVFYEYIKNFNNLKENNLIFKKISKFFINSLYGRLGMVNHNTISFFETDKTKIESLINSEYVKKITQLNEFFLFECDKNISLKKETIFYKNYLNFNSNVVYSSIIASKARIKLYLLFEKIINNDGRLLYCDTDSLYFSSLKNKNYYLKILLNEKIFWEEKKIKEVVFISPKNYGIKYNDDQEKIVIKGVKTNLIEFSNLKFLFYNNEKFIKTNNNFTYKNNFNLEERNITKYIHLQKYDKRKFIKNKKQTEPYIHYNNFYL